MNQVVDIVNEKKVLVLGAGQSGVSAVRLLLERCHPSSLALADEKPLHLWSPSAREIATDNTVTCLGAPEGIDFLRDFDVLIISPGFPPHHPWLTKPDPQKTYLTEFELGYLAAEPHHTWIGVTGTNGKTTTTRWIASLLAENGYDARPCGNIGNPVSLEVLNARPKTVFTVELSSFQLHWAQAFRPSIGILLNIDPDHIDWHGTLESYVKSKWKLFAFQDQHSFAILNMDDANIQAFQPKLAAHPLFYGLEHSATPGMGVQSEYLTLFWDHAYPVFSVRHLPFSWASFLSNLMPVILTGILMHIPLEGIRTALPHLTLLPHRLSWVSQIEGVDYYDDSKATNVHALRGALQCLPHMKIVLIAGGLAKGQDFSGLVELLRHRVRAVILIGESAPLLQRQWARAHVPIHFAGTMEDAVQTASHVACPGDAVLLSPGCASFDMFRDYAHRGEVFTNAVKALPSLPHREFARC